MLTCHRPNLPSQTLSRISLSHALGVGSTTCSPFCRGQEEAELDMPGNLDGPGHRCHVDKNATESR